MFKTKKAIRVEAFAEHARIVYWVNFTLWFFEILSSFFLLVVIPLSVVAIAYFGIAKEMLFHEPDRFPKATAVFDVTHAFVVVASSLVRFLLGHDNPFLSCVTKSYKHQVLLGVNQIYHKGFFCPDLLI